MNKSQGEAATATVEAGQSDPPSVTCVIIAYNHEKYVEVALGSAFAQTYENLRIIVCDDASTDGTQKIIRDHLGRTGHADVSFIAHEKNRGLCATLNEALALIDSDYVAFISADDWMTPDRIRIQVGEIEKLGDDFGMVCNDLFIADEAGEPTGQTYFELYECDDLLNGQLSRTEVLIRQVTRWFLPAPGFFYRTSAIRAVGGFDEALLGEDLDMTLRILHKYQIGYHDAPVVYRRELATSLSRTKQADLAKNELERITILRKHYGIDPELDAVLRRQIGARAKTIYGAGRRYSALQNDLMAAFQQDRSITTGIYVLACILRVPGHLLARPVEWARRRRALGGAK